MQDKELYQYIVGLQSPWSVSEVKLDMQSQETLVRVEHPRGTKFCCPDCRKELACYDHGEERHWRHLDSCQFKTILVARVPRVDCPTHGVKSAIVAWAEPHSRFTILFEAAVACFSWLSEEQIKSVKAVAMDMSSAYARATKQCIPMAEEKIVHDPFHVMKMANEALNSLRYYLFTQTRNCKGVVLQGTAR